MERRLKGTLSHVKTLKGSLSPSNTLKGSFSMKVRNNGSYNGPYVITPSMETQTLDTTGKRMSENVVVNPIPSNYGLITWNGAVLTVS